MPLVPEKPDVPEYPESPISSVLSAFFVVPDTPIVVSLTSTTNIRSLSATGDNASNSVIFWSPVDIILRFYRSNLLRELSLQIELF